MKTCCSPLPRILGALLLLAALSPLRTLAAAADELVPCKVIQHTPVTFPVRALNDGIVNGKAALMLEVHRDGQLGDVLVVAHSGAPFAAAAVEAVKQWEFTPASIAGEPVASILTVNVQFAVNGVTAFTKRVGQGEEQSGGGTTLRDVYRPLNVRELDRAPKPIEQPGPAYLPEWSAQGKRGAVTVDFFIDEDGHTRFARVVGEADELLGAAAVDAVKAWRFEPPTSRGQRALVQAQQTFYFRPRPKPEL